MYACKEVLRPNSLRSTNPGMYKRTSGHLWGSSDQGSAFHCGGCRSEPWSGNEDPACCGKTKPTCCNRAPARHKGKPTCHNKQDPGTATKAPCSQSTFLYKCMSTVPFNPTKPWPISCIILVKVLEYVLSRLATRWKPSYLSAATICLDYLAFNTSQIPP